MLQDDPNRQSTHSPGLSEKGLDEADALGPEYRQRITPIGQAFLSPKRLETVSRPSMTVLNLTSKAQPFGVVQRWPLEQVGALGDEIAPSAPSLFDYNESSFLEGASPSAIQRFQAPADRAFDARGHGEHAAAPVPRQRPRGQPGGLTCVMWPQGRACERCCTATPWP